MDSDNRIRQTVFAALDELNGQLPVSRRIAKEDDAPLTGVEGTLDSLGVVNLIAILEQKIEERLGTTVDLLDSGLLGDGEPLQSVNTLIGFLASALNERAHI